MNRDQKRLAHYLAHIAEAIARTDRYTVYMVLTPPAHPAIEHIHVDGQFDFMYDDRMFAAEDD